MFLVFDMFSYMLCTLFAINSFEPHPVFDLQGPGDRNGGMHDLQMYVSYEKNLENVTKHINN